MSKERGIQKDTLKKYLEYLEAAFLIKVLNKVGVDAKRLKRITSFKSIELGSQLDLIVLNTKKRCPGQP